MGNSIGMELDCHGVSHLIDKSYRCAVAGRVLIP